TDRQNRPAVLEYHRGGQRNARALPRLDTVGMPRHGIQTDQAVTVGDSGAAPIEILDVGAWRRRNDIPPTIRCHAGRCPADPRPELAAPFERLHLERIAR